MHGSGLTMRSLGIGCAGCEPLIAAVVSAAGHVHHRQGANHFPRSGGTCNRMPGGRVTVISGTQAGQ